MVKLAEIFVEEIEFEEKKKRKEIFATIFKVSSDILCEKKLSRFSNTFQIRCSLGVIPSELKLRRL